MEGIDNANFVGEDEAKGTEDTVYVPVKSSDLYRHLYSCNGDLERKTRSGINKISNTNKNSCNTSAGNSTAGSDSDSNTNTNSKSWDERIENEDATADKPPADEKNERQDVGSETSRPEVDPLTIDAVSSETFPGFSSDTFYKLSTDSVLFPVKNCTDSSAVKKTSGESEDCEISKFYSMSLYSSPTQDREEEEQQRDDQDQGRDRNEEYKQNKFIKEHENHRNSFSLSRSTPKCGDVIVPSSPVFILSDYGACEMSVPFSRSSSVGKTFESHPVNGEPLPLMSDCGYELNSQLEFHYNFLFSCRRAHKRMAGMRKGLRFLVLWPSLIFVTWALIYILFGEKESSPGGSLFALFILEFLAIIMGELMSLINLPPLIGMLGAGLILRNVDIPGISMAQDLAPSLSGPLRAISVVILLTRGAFSVNPAAIRRFIRIVPQLAFFSCVIEALAGGTAVYFLIKFPVQWSALMGCILSAMSGVAVMPFLQNLESSSKIGDGSATKVVAIAKTACGLDAILAICNAEFCLGFIFGDGKLSEGLMKGVVEVIMGGTFGLFWGFLAGTCLNDSNSSEIRTFAVFGGGTLGLLGLTKIGYPRGGPLAVFAGALLTSILWRKRQVDGVNNDKINENFTKLWYIFQPLLFGIIGCRTNLATVDWSILSSAILCLACSLTARLLTAMLMSSCFSLSRKEILFLAIAWIPKGTVQAALGPVALDTAKDLNFGPEAEKLGYQVMNIAVLTIILGSTLGSFCLLIFGPRLLRPSSSCK